MMDDGCVQARFCASSIFIIIFIIYSYLSNPESSRCMWFSERPRAVADCRCIGLKGREGRGREVDSLAFWLYELAIFEKQGCGV